MSLQLRCYSVSVPHVFRCPVGPAHRPRNSTSHERSLIRHLPVLTPSPNPPLIHHLFSIFFIHTSAAPLAAKTSRSSKRKGGVTNSCCFCSVQPPSPSAFCAVAICDFFGGKGKRASAENTPQIPLTYRSSNPSSTKHKKLCISPSPLPFLFSLLRPHSARAGRRPPPARSSVSIALRWILRPLAVRWSGDPAARASAASSFCR